MVGRIFLTILLLEICISLHAQTEFRPGYLITVEKDTLYGSIDFRRDIKNSSVCTFKDSLHNIRVFKPFEIYGYRFLDGKFYISKFVTIKNEVTPQFAECLIKGKRDIYYFRDQAGFHFLIGVRDTLKELKHIKENIHQDGVTYFKESKTYIGSLKAYFSDCPAVFEKIEKIEEPTFSNLISVTKQYHELTCGEDSCTVFYKPKFSIKMAVEPQVGLIKYRDFNEPFKQFGAILYFNLPKANERLFLKTGMLYSENSIKKSGEINNFSIIKVPLYFEYLFPEKRVRPKFDFGLNIHHINSSQSGKGATLSLGAATGVLIKIVPNVYLDLNVDLDLIYFYPQTKFIESRSMQTGLYLKF